MQGSRHSDNMFRFASIVMILAGLCYGLARLIAQLLSNAPDHAISATVLQLLMVLWLLTFLSWSILLIRRLLHSRSKRRSQARPRRRTSRQGVPSTMQTQWKQVDPATAWITTQHDTRVERNSGHAPNSVTGWWTDDDTLQATTVIGDTLGKHSALRMPVAPICWSLELLQELEWARFNEVAIGFFEAIGLQPSTLATGPQAQFSLEIRRPGATAAHAVVCLRAGAPVIEIDQIRQQYAAMTRDGMQQGFFLTGGRFSDAAVSAARGIGLFLVDGPALLQRLVSMPAAPQETLLQQVTRDDYRTPTCPSCGRKMSVRTGDFKSFWRCTGYPECKTRLSLTPPSESA